VTASGHVGGAGFQDPDSSFLYIERCFISIARGRISPYNDFELHPEIARRDLRMGFGRGAAPAEARPAKAVQEHITMKRSAPAAASSGLRLAGLPGLSTAPQTGWIPDRLGFSAAACGNSKRMRAKLPRACAGARDTRLTDG
jgi:hypothetical protein